ncbi:MAG: NAD(P)/FAD-dependent oxidoreductase, partial [Gammaproteobacteria bacterium]|nr:NAD(P)/FAD-dependent oxidoreductase [Gammaproteobacteria bacterium]
MNAKAQMTPQTTRHVDVAIIGSGFGGLCMAIQLRMAGNDNFVILEKDREVGGTWRDNHYPGCACDVQSHLYSFSFEGKPDWSKRYAPWNEIQDYILQTTEKYGIRPFVRFNADVVGAVYDESSARWTLSMADGSTLIARFVVMATGPLHVPAIPDIPGMERFQGRLF